MIETVLYGTSLHKANLSGQQLKAVHFGNTDLFGASLDASDWTQPASWNIESAPNVVGGWSRVVNLSDAQLVGSKLDGVEFQGRFLAARFKGCTFDGTSFSSSDLTGARLDSQPAGIGDQQL